MNSRMNSGLMSIEAQLARCDDLEVLSASERRYRNLFSASPAPLWEEDFSEVKRGLDDLRRAGVVDFDAYFRAHPEVVRDFVSRVRVLDVNEAALRFHRAPSKEALLAGLKQVFAEDSYACFATQLRRIAAGERLIELQVQVCTLDGEKREALLQWTSAPGSEETLNRVYISLIDITARRHAEDALREAYGIIERSGSLAAIVRNEEGWPTDFISGNVERLYGYTKAEVLSPKFRYAQIIHPADLPTVREEVSRVFQDTAVQDFRLPAYRLIAKDGTVRWVHHQGHVRRDPAGRITHLQGILEDVTALMQSDERLRRTLDSLRKGLDAAVQAIATMGELRDPYTAGHQKRVAHLAGAIALELKLPERRREGVVVMGYVHDIGKILVPAEILSKPGRLTDVEYQMIKQHPQAGHEILKPLDFPWPVAQAVLQHHERLDGSGYPQGLRGDEIILEARILGVADVVEAMASHRPYRAGLGVEQALREIESKKGLAFDARVVDACVRVVRREGSAF